MSTTKSYTTSSTKTYAPPTIPDTPSATINNMLKQRCNKTYNNPVKYGIAFYICTVFQAITTVYNAINQKKQPSHTFWMVACGIVSAVLVLKCYLLYHILMASAVILSVLLRYGFTLLALVGAGLGISGMVFFDKDAPSPGAPHRFDSMDKTD